MKVVSNKRMVMFDLRKRYVACKNQTVNPLGHDSNKYESLALGSHSSSSRFILLNLLPSHTQTQSMSWTQTLSHFPSIHPFMYQCPHWCNESLLVDSGFWSLKHLLLLFHRDTDMFTSIQTQSLYGKKNSIL